MAAELVLDDDWAELHLLVNWLSGLRYCDPTEDSIDSRAEINQVSILH